MISGQFYLVSLFDIVNPKTKPINLAKASSTSGKMILFPSLINIGLKMKKFSRHSLIQSQAKDPFKWNNGSAKNKTTKPTKNKETKIKSNKKREQWQNQRGDEQLQDCPVAPTSAREHSRPMLHRFLLPSSQMKM